MATNASTAPVLLPNGRTQDGRYFISKGELGAIIGANPRVVDALVNSGQVKTVKAEGGRRILISVPSVLALIGGLPASEVS